MKRFLAAVFAILALPILASAAVDPAGEWSGVLKVGDIKLRLLFKITKAPDSTYLGMMDSIDQGAKDMPIPEVQVKGNQLHMDVSLLKGIFEGEFDSAGNKVTVTWTQGGKPLPLTLVRGKGALEAEESLAPADVAASKQAALRLGGNWNATLKAGTDEFRLIMLVKTNANGTAGGTLDSLDQSLEGIPLSAIRYKDGKVHFEAHGMGATYDGMSFNRSTVVTGLWHQAGQNLPLKFTKTESK